MYGCDYNFLDGTKSTLSQHKTSSLSITNNSTIMIKEESLETIRIITIYENQRYQPLVGFSYKGLLPTDRRRYSTKDGKRSWASIEEAEADLVSKGWVWEHPSTWALHSDGFDESVTPTYEPLASELQTDTNTDSTISIVRESGSVGGGSPLHNASDEGWIYSASFETIDDSNLKLKNITTFVRRMKLHRMQKFYPLLLCGMNCEIFTCSYCDSDKVESLRKLLLTTLAEHSLTKHPRQLDEVKVNVLKNALIDALHLNGDKPGTDEAISLYHADSTSEIPLDIEKVEDILKKFSLTGATLLTRSSSLLSVGSADDNIQKRTSEIAQLYFGNAERGDLARLVIRRHDCKDNKYHCKKVNCKENDKNGEGRCLFKPEKCKNENCDAIYSRIWNDRHDTMCPHKIVDCERLCGERLPRYSLESHVTGNCPLKPVTCPFQILGCDVYGNNNTLLQKDLQQHLECCTQPHMALCLTNIVRQGEAIANVSSRIAIYDTKLDQNIMMVGNVAAAINNCMIGLEKLNEKVRTDLSNEVNRLESRFSGVTEGQKKLIHSFSSQSNNEISKIYGEVTRINGEINKLHININAITKGPIKK